MSEKVFVSPLFWKGIFTEFQMAVFSFSIFKMFAAVLSFAQILTRNWLLTLPLFLFMHLTFWGTVTKIFSLSLVLCCEVCWDLSALATLDALVETGSGPVYWDMACRFQTAVEGGWPASHQKGRSFKSGVWWYKVGPVTKGVGTA